MKNRHFIRFFITILVIVFAMSCSKDFSTELPTNLQSEKGSADEITSIITILEESPTQKNKMLEKLGEIPTSELQITVTMTKGRDKTAKTIDVRHGEYKEKIAKITQSMQKSIFTEKPNTYENYTINISHRDENFLFIAYPYSENGRTLCEVADQKNIHTISADDFDFISTLF